MWNFVKNFPLPLPFPIITGHGTEKVLLMKFEILGLVNCFVSLGRNESRSNNDFTQQDNNALQLCKIHMLWFSHF